MADDTGPLGTTEEILHAIDSGMEAPDMLSWAEWQAWRAKDGRRPAVRRGDSTSTTIAEESKMWREVMSAIHGPGWQVEMRTLNRDVAKAGGSDGASQFDGGESAGLVDGGQLGAAQFDEGDGVPAAESVLDGRSAAGSKSLGAQTTSDGPCGTLALRERLMVGIDLGKETAAEFTGRIRRIADTLDVLDDPVSDEDIAEIMSRGEYTARLKELPSDTQVTLLKDMLNNVI